VTANADIVVVDTDVFSYLHKETKERELFLPVLEGRIPVLTFITIGELWKGAYERGWAEHKIAQMKTFIENQFVILPPHRELAFKWAEIMARSKKKGITVNHNDGWIAASAMIEGCPLVTNNTKHFVGIEGLQLLP